MFVFFLWLALVRAQVCEVLGTCHWFPVGTWSPNIFWSQSRCSALTMWPKGPALSLLARLCWFSILSRQASDRRQTASLAVPAEPPSREAFSPLPVTLDRVPVHFSSLTAQPVKEDWGHGQRQKSRFCRTSLAQIWQPSKSGTCFFFFFFNLNYLNVVLLFLHCFSPSCLAVLEECFLQV